MSITFYISRNYLNNTDENEIARTIVFNTYNTAELIEDAAKGSTLLESDIKSANSVILESLKKLLTKGAAVEIEGLGRFTSRVKGKFGVGERFDKNKHRIELNFTPDPDLVEHIRNNAVVEQIDRNVKLPFIKKLITGKGKENIVRRFYTNHLVGNNLKQNKIEIAGIKIIKEDDHTKFIDIPFDQLDIDSHTNKEIVFSLINSINLPDWLVHDLPIDISLMYTTDEARKIRATDYHLTRFIVNG